MQNPLVEKLLLLARLAVGVVLIASGFLKAVGPQAEFAAVIQAYHLVPASWANPIALVLPWMELWAGTFLFFGCFTRFFAGVGFTLFFVFALALASVLIRGIDLVSCGCFGAAASSPRHTILIDGIALLLSLTLLTKSKEPLAYSLDRWIESTPLK